MANKKARVLIACSIGGIDLRPNDVVNFPESLIKAHIDQVDTNKEAVAYALSINGGNVIGYADPVQAQRTTLEEKIAQLESSLAAAAEDEKGALAADLAAAQAQLAALG